MDTTLQQTVADLIQTRNIARINARSVARTNIVPDTIYLFTWENLKFSTQTDEVINILTWCYNIEIWIHLFWNFAKSASFQLILASSTTEQKTFALFKYFPSSFSVSSTEQSVFIGYNTGSQTTKGLVNIFSNLNNIDAIPTLISNEPGNTSKN